MRILTSLLAVLSSSIALAAPPYDVSVVLTAPATGGNVATYVLLLDGVPAPASTQAAATPDPADNVVLGANSYPELLQADGNYVLQVSATNAAGTALSNPVTVNVSELLPPGAPGIQVQIDCAPCVLSVNP